MNSPGHPIRTFCEAVEALSAAESDDSIAGIDRWSVAVAPSVARALVTNAPLPTPADPLAHSAVRRDAYNKVGAMLGEWTLPNAAPLARLLVESVSSDAALRSLVAPLFAIGLAIEPSDRRQRTLGRLPVTTQQPVIAAFERQRGTTPTQPVADAGTRAIAHARRSIDVERDLLAHALLDAVGSVLLVECSVIRHGTVRLRHMHPPNRLVLDWLATATSHLR